MAAVATIVAALVLVALAGRAIGGSTRPMAGLFRYDPGPRPVGLQESETTGWTWAATPRRTARSEPHASVDDAAMTAEEEPAPVEPIDSGSGLEAARDRHGWTDRSAPNDDGYVRPTEPVHAPSGPHLREHDD